jgi:hypothetical protein
MQKVVDEVLKHLIEIIEILLLEENSNNYINFMKKMQEMNAEMEKKISIMLEDRLEGLKIGGIGGIGGVLGEATPTKVRRADGNNQLKQQRKNYAQSILAGHRSNTFAFSQQKS